MFTFSFFLVSMIEYSVSGPVSNAHEYEVVHTSHACFLTRPLPPPQR